MRYRVKFQLPGQVRGHFYTEWFDTFEEARGFYNLAWERDALEGMQIEDEDGEVV